MGFETCTFQGENEMEFCALNPRNYQNERPLVTVEDKELKGGYFEEVY